MLWFGEERVKPLKISTSAKAPRVEWQTFRRRDLSSVRHTRPGQFYPIYVNEQTGRIEHVGRALPHDIPKEEAPGRPGCIAVFPVRPDGTEMNWAITVPSLKNRWAKGYARAGKFTGDAQPYIIQYLKSGPINDIEEGRATIVGRKLGWLSHR